MNIDDLEHARPKANKLNQVLTRDVMKIEDIEGTKAKARHCARKNSQGYSAFDYNDVTKQMRVSQRCSNPLDPVYTFKGEDGKEFTIGSVDGSKPAKMPTKPNVEGQGRAGSLNTADIDGATTSTKGLGVFAHVKRREDQMKSTRLDTNEIDGAKAGSLLKGPKTKRVTNPLDGNYQIPGWTELKDNGNPYSLTKKEETFKKSQSTLQKTGAQAMGITESKGLAKAGMDMLPEHKQKSFKNSYGAFYGVEERDATKLDYNKLYQASREAPKGTGMAGIPKNMQESSKFAKDTKLFFNGEASETASAYDKAVQGFFGPS